MRSRRGPVVAVVVAVFWWLGGGSAMPIATGQSQGSGEAPLGFLANDNPPAPAASASPGPPPANPAKVDDLLNLDIDQLSNVRVSTAAQATNLNAPSNQITTGDLDFHGATTTGELAEEAPSVSTVRLSAINLDPRVRGYNSGQLNTSANGMTEVKTRLDIDSALSQIDPGVVGQLTVIDGPYSSLYGPGFAFIATELLPTPRYADGPEAHLQTTLVFDSNGQSLYDRDTVLGGGANWGFCASYGLRTANDYLSGGANPERIPSAYQKWDDLLSVSLDVSPFSRVEFDYIHCEMNGVQLPGVVYDLDNSTNSQFNLRYIVQEDRQGPKQLVIQGWYQETDYRGDASRQSKQDSFYNQFITLPNTTDGDDVVNTLGIGQSINMGARLLRTFGARDAPQWTIGADWRRTDQFYREYDFDPSGQLALNGGDLYGLPQSCLDDYGVLTDLSVPWSDAVSMTMGGRVDYCHASLNAQDPVVTQFSDPSQYYYAPEFNQPSDVLGMAYVSSKIKLTQESTLNAGAAFAMRMPCLAELYSDDPYVPIAQFGNSYVSGFSGLLPEKNLQLDLGISTVEKDFSWGVRGFFALMWDYIEPAPAFIDGAAPPGSATYLLGRNFQYFPPIWREDLSTGTPNADTSQAGYLYINEQLATLGGGDVFAEAKLADWLSVHGNIAYVNGTNWHPMTYVASTYNYSASTGTLVPIGHPEGLPSIYPLTATLSIRLHEAKSQRWLVEFSSRLVAAQDHVAASISEVPSPAFATFSLRGCYQAHKNLRLTAAIDNLLNTEYYEPGALAIINSHGVPTFVQAPGIGVSIGLDARL